MAVTAIAPWFGSNRLLTSEVGKLLGKCTWVGVPFTGGMSELPYISARTIVVNDLHRHVVNLARVVASDETRSELIKRLEAKAFHPDELATAQRISRDWDFTTTTDDGVMAAAEAYFVTCWMGRSSQAGTDKEFDGGLALRWNAAGGDSAVRYHSAVKMLEQFSMTLRRCMFSTLDAFEWFGMVKDQPGHAIYCDPPFLGAGVDYQHNAGEDAQAQLLWHTRLRDAVERFQQCKVVMRFHDCEAIRGLYRADKWDYHEFQGRTQANREAKELLLLRCACAQ